MDVRRVAAFSAGGRPVRGGARPDAIAGGAFFNFALENAGGGKLGGSIKTLPRILD
ncbi:hypothetical protein KM539_09490 [Xanthomonas translucens pv. poae]|uniref:hypothetical protein n=1 Tax=Xanthomonas graminis TaxID=3390026 RepID=UPI000ADF9AB2|nr:hypothetical protein [Xanthomonas translucens]UKE63641.1 hypothetical protein KM539_09490 [Xanthomonas translucens pv. poae]